MQRTIFLVDMNAFFISCEMTRNPEIAGKPAAVAGDPRKRSGIILAANYEARKFGVKTAMVLHEAMKLCPGMRIIPPDHRFYDEKSREVMELLSSYSPIIEQNSIDEAWLDMTGCEGLFGKPVEAARQIMDRIINELGLWCSIGISYNKFLAKMASEIKKPLGITEIWEKDLESRLWPLPVGSMYGIGKQTAHKLQNLMIETIGDLANYNKVTIIKSFGKAGSVMHEHANGIDSSPVIPHTHGEMKSIGRSTTLTEDITDLETAKNVIIKLSDEIGMTARRHNKKGRTVHITIKYSDFQVITRQTSIPATYLTKEIYTAGINLLSSNWSLYRPVRLLGISLSGFNEDYESDQISMFGMTEEKQQEVKEEKLEKVLDSIRYKHGNAKINRAILIRNTKSDK